MSHARVIIIGKAQSLGATETGTDQASELLRSFLVADDAIATSVDQAFAEQCHDYCHAVDAVLDNALAAIDDVLKTKPL